MPTKRTIRSYKSGALGPIEVEHLQTGSYHWMTGSCRLCVGGPAAVEAAWRSCNRDEVLENWRRLKVPFPSFAEVWLDGERLPELNKNWRWLHQVLWSDVAHELGRVTVDRARDA